MPRFPALERGVNRAKPSLTCCFIAIRKAASAGSPLAGMARLAKRSAKTVAELCDLYFADAKAGRMSAYTQAFQEQVMVSVACNGAHSLKQRLARWLLMMRDRSDGDALPITQNLLAEMLGVQRPTITNAAGELEGAGLIQRGRQQVAILDRQGLVKASCECYRLVRERVAFHLPKTYK
jgi:hypothetical protein